MKVRNIMFSGFAAAILMGTANAATTPFEIASKAYVDAQVRGATSNVGDTIGDMTTLQNGNDSNIDAGTDNVVDALNDLDDAIDTKQNEADSNVSGTLREGTHLTAGHGVATNLINLDTALGTAEGKIDSLEDAVNGDGTNPGLSEIVKGDPNDPTDNGLAGRVQTLEGTVGSGTMTVAGATQADVIAAINALDNKTEGIATDANLQQLETAVGLKQNEADSNVAAANMVTGSHLTAGHGVAANLVALDTNLVAAEGDIDDLETAVGSYDSATGQGTGLLKDVADLQDALNDQTTGLDPRVQALENTVGDSTAGLVKDVDDLQDTMGTGTLTGFSNGVDTVIAALNDLQANKLNKPIPNECSAQSEHCVLHMDNTGALSWVDITVPYTEETQTEP